MDKPALDLEPFRTAERLEWRAWTVFDGDQPGEDGNVDGDLRAISDDQVATRLPLDIFTPAAHRAYDDQGAGPWMVSGGEVLPLGLIVADPRTAEEVREQICRWCRAEIGRDDVEVVL